MESDTISVKSPPSEASRGTPASRPFNATATTRETWIKVREVDIEQPVDNPMTIFKVPKPIREMNPKAYDPVVASVGPFHHCPYCWSSVMQEDSKIQTKSQLDGEAYKPVAASCGHFDSTSAMQKYKWRCVWHLLSLLRGDDQERANQLLEESLVKLMEKNDEVRSCYSEELPPWMDDRRLASIMLLDGCFIIYFMLNSEEDALGKKMIQYTIDTEEGNVVLNIKEKDKLLVAGLFTSDFVLEDLLKLENQIPFFIIQLLFDQLKPCDDDLVDLALNRLEDIHPEESGSFRDEEKKYLSPGKYHHLLHLFHSSRIPVEKEEEDTTSRETPTSAPGCNVPVEKKEEDTTSQGTPTSASGCILGAIEYMKSTWKKVVVSASSQGSTQGTSMAAPKWRIPSAMELDRAGVKFRKKKLPPDSFLNITFKWTKMKFIPLLCQLYFTSGRMEIPPLQINDTTGPLFENLIAFEQCYPYTRMYITTYAIFMDFIIDQAEDVRLLRSKGILEHLCGNDQEVADLFNELGSRAFYFKQNYLESQINEINEFYGFKWHKWLAGLRRDYLGNPWAIISMLAAIVLLLLTMEQAIFSALSYFHSP